jgi:hypothetical protein
MRSAIMVRAGLLRAGGALCAACVLVVCAGWAASAQEPPPQGGAAGPAAPRPKLDLETTISAKPTIIAAQVWSALEFEKTALRMVQNSGGLDSIQEIRETVHHGYALLRVATNGLEFAMNKSKYPNPMLQMRHEKIMEIRGTLNRCMLLLDNAQQLNDAQFVPTATEDLESAIDLLQDLAPRML